MTPIEFLEQIKIAQIDDDIYVGLIVPELGFCSAKVSKDFADLALEWDRRRRAVLAAHKPDVGTT
jgi:hypothetical protein